MGTVVYCVVISLGEMVSYLPNVGGPVGLAHLYADPALAFTLGKSSRPIMHSSSARDLQRMERLV